MVAPAVGAAARDRLHSGLRLESAPPGHRPRCDAAVVDRLVHHAEVIGLKGDRFRMRGKGDEVLTGEQGR